MTRPTSTDLDVELAKPITAVGYLVQLALLSTYRWCDLEQFTWNGQTWLQKSFTVQGLEFSSDVDLTCRLTIDNTDDAIGTILRNPAEKLYEALVTIYQFARGASDLEDVPQMALMSVTGCRVSPQNAILTLAEANTNGKFSPRRSISPINGFNFATPAGTVLYFSGETVTLEADGG